MNTFQMCFLVFPLTEMLSFDSFSYSDLVWLSEPGIPGILIRLVWTNYRLAAGKSGTHSHTTKNTVRPPPLTLTYSGDSSNNFCMVVQMRLHATTYIHKLINEK